MQRTYPLIQLVIAILHRLAYLCKVQRPHHCELVTKDIHDIGVTHAQAKTNQKQKGLAKYDLIKYI